MSSRGGDSARLLSSNNSGDRSRDSDDSGGGGGSGSPRQLMEELAYKRKKRITLRSAEEGAAGRRNSRSGGGGGVGNVVPLDEDDEEDDAELGVRGWPTWLQVQRRLRFFWSSLRLATVLKVVVGVVLVVLLVRTVRHRVEDRDKATHFSLVALLRDMREDHMSASAPPNDRWQFAFQFSALQSWSRHLRGDHILVFVDKEPTCDFIENHVRDIQCFVIPKECFHAEYQKPRLDCIFPVAHAHAPTETMVYLNSDVLIGPDLGQAIAVVQSKQSSAAAAAATASSSSSTTLGASSSAAAAAGGRFLITARRTDLPVSADMLDHFRAPEFVDRLMALATGSTSEGGGGGGGHLHGPDALDLFVYDRGYFSGASALRSFPPFLAGAPAWDAWFLSQAILDDSVQTIDATSVVTIVHLERARSPGQHASAPRVGAPYNEELARKLAGNAWKVGANINNCDMVLVGNCALGAANVKAMPSHAAGGATASAAAGANTDGSAVVDAASAATPSSTQSVHDPTALSGGCYLAPNPNVTDLVLFTRRASPSGFLVVLAVNSGYMPLALNWLCWAERVRLANYVVLAEDQAAAAKLRARGVPVVLAKNAPEINMNDRGRWDGSASGAGGGGGSPLEFEQSMLLRSEFLWHVLSGGFHFVAADADGMWLDDALAILGSQDPPADLSASETFVGAESSAAGILAVRATTFGRFFWNKVLECQRNNVAVLINHAADSTSSASAAAFDPSLYTAQACIDRHTRLLDSQPQFTHRVLDPFVFPGGSSFFEEHLPQLRGVVPAVLHNNHLLGGGAGGANTVQAKQARLVAWGLNAADPETEECIVAAPMPFPDLKLPSSSSSSSAPSFRLRLRVLTYNRPASLGRLLRSLLAADYLGDSVRLEVSIDHPVPSPSEEDVAAWGESVVLANAFDWPHGPKIVIEQPHNIGLVGQWLRGWVPVAGEDGGDEELCMFLEDDLALQPDWYRWLRPTIRAYYLDPRNFDPKLFGVSLQKQHTILGESHTAKFGSRTPADVLARMAAVNAAAAAAAKAASPSSPAPPSKVTHLYKYQLLGTTGALFFPQHWRAFLGWLESRGVDTILGTSGGGSARVPCVPTLVSNTWWLRDPHANWSAWFNRWAFEQGFYGLYANFPEGGTLALNYREPGLNDDGGGPTRKARGPLHPGLVGLSPADMYMPPSDLIPVFDFHFNLVANPDTLVWRKFLTNEKFLGVAAAAAPTTMPLSNPLAMAAAVATPSASANMQCWTIEQLVEQTRKEKEARRALEAAARVAAEIADTKVRAEHEAVLAVEAAKKNATDTAAAAAKAKKTSTGTGAAASKSKSKDSKSSATGAASKPKSGSKPSAAPTAADSAADAARKSALVALAALPEKDLLATGYFDPSSDWSVWSSRVLGGALDPLFKFWKKSRWLTLRDGWVFGAVAAFVQDHVDSEATVSASSEASDATLVLAQSSTIAAVKRLKTSTTIQVLDPPHMKSLKDAATDWVLALDTLSVPSAAAAAKVAPITKYQFEASVEEMVRVAKKGCIVIEKQDTDIKDPDAAAFPDTLKTALAPIVSKNAAPADVVHADAAQLYRVAKKHKLLVFFKVFNDASDVALAKKEEAAGTRPFALMATLMLKKAPSAAQLASLTKAGYIAVPTDS